MTRASKWKTILTAALTILFALTLAFAVNSVVRASAEETITFTIKTDGNGSMSVNGTTASNPNEEVTVSATKGGTVTLTAKPAEGYTVCYYGKYRTSYYNESYNYYEASYFDDEVEITPSAGDKYNVHFVKTDGTPEIVAGEGFVKEGDGETAKYFYDLYSDSKVETAYQQSGMAASQITIDYYGEKYLSFSYVLAAGSMDSLEFSDNYTAYTAYNRGTSDSVYATSTITEDTLEQSYTNKLWNPTGNRAHHIVLAVNENKYSEAGLEKCYIKDIKLTDRSVLAIHPMELHVPENSQVSVNGQLIEYTELNNGVYKNNFATGENVAVELSNLAIDSTIDGSTRVLNEVIGLYPADNEQLTLLKSDTQKFYRSSWSSSSSKELDNDRNSETYTFVPTAEGVYEHKFVWSSRFDSEGDNQWHTESFKGGYIEARYKEHLPTPEIKLTKTIKGASQQEETVTNGEAITLEFGVTNSLLFSLGELDDIPLEFTVNKTDSHGTESVPILTDNKKGFSLVNVQENTSIEILTKDTSGKYFDSYAYVLNISMTSEEGIQKIVDSAFNLTVENSDEFEWFLDPANNGDTTYAYKAGNFNTKDLKIKLSQIKIDVSQYAAKAGQLKFEFKIDGRVDYAQAAYNIDAPVTTTTKPYPFSIETGTLFAKAQSNRDEDRAPLWVAPTLSNGAQKLDGEGVNTWYTMGIPVDVGKQTVYIAYVDYYGYEYPTDEFVIRNVMFLQGDAEMKWGVKNSQQEVKDESHGTITVTKGAGEEVEAGTLDIGTVLTFTANPDGKKHFYGWVDEEGQILSTELSFKYTVSKATSIYALIDGAGTYAVSSNGKFYKATEIEDALTSASTGKDKNVVVVDDVTLTGITVPAGVNLVIPFNRTGDFYAMGTKTTATAEISWAGGTYAKPVYTLTLEGENKVLGTITVGGVLHYPDQSAQGHTSGYYSELVLNGTVEVGNGGTMDVYGRVTGKGSINVLSGGVLFQPFLILDYSGGNNTYDLFYLNQTPFKRYAMINIQCEGGYTVNYGGELWGHASLYFLSSVTTLDTPFISYTGSVQVGEKAKQGTTTLINLTTAKSKATGVYKDEKFVSSGGGNTANIGHTALTIEGGAKAGFMSFLDMVQTDEVIFSIPYNYDLILTGDGEYEIPYAYKLMPGASLTVEKGSTLNITSTFLVYDGLVQSKMSGKGYPTAAELTANHYYSTNANFIVNGTLNIKAKATFLGVIQTTNTETGDKAAKITVEEGATLKGKIVDGGTTDYDCNQTEYDSSMRLFDKAHGEKGILVSIPVNEEGKAQKAMTFTSTYSDKDTFTLPAVSLKYDNFDGYASNTSENHVEHGKEGGHWADGTTEEVTGLTGSWRIEHDAHAFDWSLSDGDKNLNGAKYKELTRQCTELGCTDKEHKLLLAEAFSLEDTYKASEFTNADLVKLFYKYYFGKETPEGFDFFHAEVTHSSGTIQGANIYEGLTVTLTGGFFGENAESVTKTFTFTVKPFDVANLDTSGIESKIQEKNFTYNGEAKQLTNEELEAALDAAFGSKVAHFAFDWKDNIAAGTNTASVTIKGDGNFEGTLVVHFSIAKAALSVTLEETTQTYGTAPVTPKIKVEGAKNGEDDAIMAAIVRTAKANQWSDVGDYGVNWSYNENDGVLKNYELSFTNKDAALYKVTAKAIAGAATATATGVTYNGKVQEAVLSFTFDGYTDHFAKDTDYTVSYAKGEETSPENAGTYTVTITGTKNYTGSITCEYVISRKAVTVTVNAQTFTYDRTAHSYNDKQDGAWTVKDLAEGDDESMLHVTITGSATDAGKYAVECGFENDNYTVSFSGKETALVIEAAEITEVTVSGSYTYNGAVQEPKFTVKAGTLTLNTGEYTISYDKPEVKDADSYTITVAAKNGNFKDKDTKASAVFTIAKAAVTVKAADKTTPQNEAISQEFNYSVTAGRFFGSDETELAAHFKYTTEATSKEVRDFEITIDWADGYDCKNYTVTFEKGTYHIIEAIFKNVAVTGTDPVPYDGQSHTLTINVNNEALDGLTTTKITKDGQPFSGATDAGTYSLHVEITAQGYTTKYESDFVLTISKVKVEVTFDAQSSVYGEPLKAELTYNMPAGVLEQDKDTFKAAIAAANPHTTATSKSAVGGNYKITAGIPELKNYDVTIKDGVYTITVRAVEVTVNKQTVTYNQAQQSAQSRNGTDWTVTGLASGDDASVLKIALAASATDAGSYDITASWTNNNYAVTFKGGNGLTVESNKVKAAFVINAAALTEATVTGSYTYNGQEQTPTFNVKAGGLTVNAQHFTVDYAGADRVSAGTVNVTVKANSANYSGEIKTQFTIAAKRIKVTLTAQSAEYSGQVPTPNNKAYTVEQGGLCSRNGKEDDLGVVITLVDGNKNAGSYGLDASASNKNYEVEFEKSARFTVTKKQITVKADDFTSTYGDTVKTLTYTATGLVDGEDPKTVLSITLEAERTIKDVGTYTITGKGSADNYTFEVANGTYTVEKRAVTVKINDRSTLYDGTEPSVPQGKDVGWVVENGTIVEGDNLQIVLTKAPGVDADEYAISGACTNGNYEVTFRGTLGETGKFTVTKRAVTVEILAQSETYDYEKAQKLNGKAYAFDGGKWNIVTSEGDGLASNETEATLNVTLRIDGTPENAGSYDIVGEYSNGNYTVTFQGGDGAYTIGKADISNTGDFVIMAGDEALTGNVFRLVFAGTPIRFTGSVLLGESVLPVTLDFSPEEITETGEVQLTVTVQSENYSGSRTFRVIVTNADGYTNELVEALEELADLTEGMTAEALTAEDFDTLKQVAEILAGLTEDEKTVGADELAPYEALVAAWNEKAEGLDGMIETAQSIGGALLEGLFGVAAVMSVLAAAAYVFGKGGIL